MNEILKYISQFFLLIFCQVLLVDNLSFGYWDGYFAPVIYFLYLLSLPVALKGVALLLFAFVGGLIVDVFESTPGLHASSILVVALFRSKLLNLLAPRDGFESELKPNVYTLGFNRYIIYIGSCLMIYHFWFFILESLKISYLHIQFFKAFLSSLLAAFIILLIQFTFLKRK